MSVNSFSDYFNNKNDRLRGGAYTCGCEYEKEKSDIYNLLYSCKCTSSERKTTETTEITPIPEKVFKEADNVFILGSNAYNIATWALQYPDIETGGALFGFISKETNNPVVHAATGPGKGSRRTTVAFYQNVDGYTHLIWEKFNAQIGTWHSHHKLYLDRPSSGDMSSVARNAKKDPGINHLLKTKGYLMIIVNLKNRSGEPNVKLSPYMFYINPNDPTEDVYYKKIPLNINYNIPSILDTTPRIRDIIDNTGVGPETTLYELVQLQQNLPILQKLLLKNYKMNQPPTV